MFTTTALTLQRIASHLLFHYDDELFEHRTLYEETPEVNISPAK
ncbi:MAG: hypothetical protein RIB71_21855 [Imperialibacter sp.]